jgi:hypothetical protein
MYRLTTNSNISNEEEYQKSSGDLLATSERSSDDGEMDYYVPLVPLKGEDSSEEDLNATCTFQVSRPPRK